MNKKYALCVGNNYPGTSAQLSGCVNDANDWAGLLANQGYQVEVLFEARKRDVMNRLVDLVAKAGWGDRIVFTYSGHGTWMPDRDGDEVDGRDEALVMADYMQGGLITDDDLQRVFGASTAGTGVLILSDSCHSGTVSRFSRHQVGADAAKPRFLSPAEFTDLTVDQVARAEEKAASAPRRTASLISGCGDLEFSYDAWFSGRANGAFTKAAIQTFRTSITLNTWFKAIRELLPTDSYPQSPELTATPYRKYTRAI